LEETDGDWFYLVDGVRHGPVPEASLREYIRVGALEPETLVWTEGMSTWSQADLVLPERAQTRTPSPLLATDPVFFPVSTLKFALMSLATFGFYVLYWMYRNWAYLKRAQNLKIMPFWRAWFVLFFAYSLLKRMREVLEFAGYPGSYSPGWLAAGYLIALLFNRLPAPLALLGGFAWVFLVPVVQAVAAVNRGRVPDSCLNARFSAWNVVALVGGGALWALALVNLVVG